MKKLIKKLTNPYDFTHIYLKKLIRKYGYEVGEYSYGWPIVRAWGGKSKLTIGSYCSFADQVQIFMGGNHRNDFVTTYPFADFSELWPEAAGLSSSLTSNGAVTIGSDVWVGSGALLLSGVTIGHGAVIGARAVVSKDIPPYAIAVGNPVRIARYRFDEDTIKRLLASAWWEFPKEKIAPLIPLLIQNNPDAFLSALKR